MRVGQTEGTQGDDDEALPPTPTAADTERLSETIERPLSAFSDREIMEELEMRFPAFVFYAQVTKADDQSHSLTWNKGTYATIVGLATLLSWRLHRDL